VLTSGAATEKCEWSLVRLATRHLRVYLNPSLFSWRRTTLFTGIVSQWRFKQRLCPYHHCFVWTGDKAGTELSK